MTMTHAKRKRIFLAAILGLLAIVGGAAFYWHLHHDPAHHHGGHGSGAELVLNDGKKWATDEPLRQGMERLNGLVSPLLRSGANPELGVEQGQQLAAGVQEQVSFLITNCKLEPKADVVLHGLIGGLLEGSEKIAKRETAIQGLAALREALEQYPKYFDHPGWKPVGSV